jgi:hypothetical protein
MDFEAVATFTNPSLKSQAATEMHKLESLLRTNGIESTTFGSIRMDLFVDATKSEKARQIIADAIAAGTFDAVKLDLQILQRRIHDTE